MRTRKAADVGSGASGNVITPRKSTFRRIRSRAFDTMVVNDNLDKAVEEIVKFIRHKRSGGI